MQKRDCPGCRWSEKKILCACKVKWCRECMNSHTRCTGCQIIDDPDKELLQMMEESRRYLDAYY